MPTLHYFKTNRFYQMRKFYNYEGPNNEQLGVNASSNYTWGANSFEQLRSLILTVHDTKCSRTWSLFTLLL